MHGGIGRVVRRMDRVMRFRALALALLALLCAAPGAWAASSVTIDAREFGTGKPLAGYSYIVNVDNARDSGDANKMNHPGLGGSESNSPVVATGQADPDTHTFLDAGGDSAIVVQAQHGRNVAVQVSTLTGGRYRLFVRANNVVVESSPATGNGRLQTPQDAIDWADSSNYVFISAGSANPNSSSSRPVATGVVALTGGTTPAAVTLPDGPQPGAHPDLAAPDGNPYPDSRYLVSVRAPGHKLWGKHIRLPRDAGTVRVDLRPYPLPFGKAIIYVFHDNAWTNSAPDDGEAGLEGFHVTLKDQMGLQVSTDGNGDPLCGGTCTTDSDGYVEIPNLAPGTYFAEAFAPRGSGYIQTSTFLGAQPVQVGVEEGAEGSGSGSELLWLPPAKRSLWFFGFVKRMKWPTSGPLSNGTGTITGTAKNWISWPPTEVLSMGENVQRPWLALTDRGSNSQVYMTRGHSDGTFTFPRVPAGSYTVSIWDEDLSYIIRFINVDIAAGEHVDLNTVDGDGDGQPDGAVGVPRWFGWLSGYVYKDTNGNGLRDDGEQPIPNTDVDERWRDGSIKAATFTDKNGHYDYPQAEGGANGKWFIGEVGFGRFATTGASLHSEYNYNDVTNVPTDLGGGLLTNQIISEGHHHDVDWGKQDYPEGTPGQIVGVVYHASTRNEVEARKAAHEDYEPGIPGVKVVLKGLGPDNTPNTADDPILNDYETDHWSQPKNCVIKDVLGAPVTNPDTLNPVFGPLCVETPNLGTQTKDGAFDGGYAFADMCPLTSGGASTFPCAEGDLVPITPGTYITQVVMPNDGSGHDLYQITKEEDVNVDTGAEFVPQIPAFPCVGNDHVVHGAIARARTNGKHFRLCDQRLVTLKAKQNANADFYLFTKSDVQIPGRVMGLVSNDVYTDNDPNSIWYISPRPEPDVPIGIYDRQPSRGGRLITTVSTDENGEFEALLPSTDTMNCPTPQGMCPGMYWFEVNDPGARNHPNPNYKQNLLSEGGSYDVWPGQLDQLDLPVIPISGQGCALPAGTPELQQVSKAVVSSGDGGGARQITIEGSNFGPNPGTVTLNDPSRGAAQSRTLGPAVNASPGATGGLVSWSETKIVIQVPAVDNTNFRAGPKQLMIHASTGASTATGISIHVRGGAGANVYNPPIVNVGTPSSNAHALQNAIDGASAGDLLLLTQGTYEENVIMNKPVMIQGLGPGGNTQMTTNPNNEPAPLLLGTAISGRFFNTSATAWRNKLNQMKPFSGNQAVPEAAGITVIARSSGTNSPANLRTSAFPTSGLSLARIDGIYVKVSQGQGAGGIQVNAWARNLQITNDVIEGNGGESAGGIGLGSPYVGNNNNTGIRIQYDLIDGNGARSKAGGVGIFNGADNYQLRNAIICSNYSFEYGAGVSHYGLSPGGTIADNRVYYNDSFDSGGGISISSELPQPTSPNAPQPLGAGSGTVDVDRNLIQSNFSGDDGGGLFLQNDLTARINVRNNMIVNNASAHLGGGIQLVNSSNVAIVNDTIAYNNTTGSGEGRDGRPHGAAVASEVHNPLFQAIVGNNAPHFSQPVAMYNNIFTENRAYTLNLSTTPASLTDAGLMDFEIDGVNGTLNPRRSILSTAYPAPGNSGNIIGADPLFAAPFVNEYEVTGNRIDPQLVSVTIVRPNPPNSIAGDYHINAGSPAFNAGVNTLNGIAAPTNDFDGQPRPGPGPPFPTRYDMGADER